MRGSEKWLVKSFKCCLNTLDDIELHVPEKPEKKSRVAQNKVEAYFSLTDTRPSGCPRVTVAVHTARGWSASCLVAHLAVTRDLRWFQAVVWREKLRRTCTSLLFSEVSRKMLNNNLLCEGSIIFLSLYWICYNIINNSVLFCSINFCLCFSFWATRHAES